MQIMPLDAFSILLKHFTQCDPFILLTNQSLERPCQNCTGGKDVPRIHTYTEDQAIQLLYVASCCYAKTGQRLWTILACCCIFFGTKIFFRNLQ